MTGIFLFERHAGLRQRPAHFLDIAKPHADAGAAELDGESDFADFHASADIVGLHFFRAAPVHAGRFMRNARIGEGPAHDARPCELVRLERGGRADIGFGIEAQAQRLKDFPHRAHERRIQMFLAQAVEAGIAFDALVAIDGGAVDVWVDVDRAHRTNVSAVAAGDAFFGVDLHDCLMQARSAARVDLRCNRAPRRSRTAPRRPETARSSRTLSPDTPARSARSRLLYYRTCS